MHVFDYIDSPEANPIAKEFFSEFCKAAIDKNREWIEKNMPFVTWRGTEYICSGSSRFGDVWLREIGSDVYYNHRVDVAELSDWRRPETANVKTD